MAIVAGVDYSLTSPALCVNKGAFSFENCSFHYLTSTKKYDGKFLNGKFIGKPHRLFSLAEERYNNISAWAIDILNGVDWLVIEDYAFAATGRVFHIAENTGLLKHQLWRFQKPFAVVAPTTVKKFATGKGNADKPMMVDAFIGETGCNILQIFDMAKVGSPVSDIVDSFYMAKYADKLLKEMKN